MKDILRYFDKTAFFVLVAIPTFGILVIYSASNQMATSYWSKQLLWLLLALIVFFVVFRIKTDVILRFSIPIYIALAVLLAIQLAAGELVAGTKSWIKTGFFNIQVSEFIKIPAALFMAKTLAKIPEIQWKEFIQLSAIIGVPFFLIALQPDLGTAFMLVSFFIAALMLKKIKWLVLVVFFIGIAASFYIGWTYLLKPYQQDRLVSFIDPSKYQKSIGYQVVQSKIAVGSGGLTGKGYLGGTQSQYQFLPTRHTDFIASVLGEELGFLGISFLFLLFFILLYRQFNFKSQSDEEFYFAYMFNSIILFQFMVNIMMVIGFVPILGVPLPLFSYGGSSLLAFFTGEAIIFKMKINSFVYEY